MSTNTTYAQNGIIAKVLNAQMLGVITLSASLLVYISYRFEVNGYEALLGPYGTERLVPNGLLSLAEGLAAGLNSAKIALIYIAASLASAPGISALVPHLLRAFVLILSLIITLLIFGAQTISPGAEAQVNEIRTNLIDVHERERANLTARFDARSAAVTTRFAQEIERVFSTRDDRLRELKVQLDAERKRGYPNFKGPAYNDIERLIQEEKDHAEARLDALRDSEQSEIRQIESAREARLDVIGGQLKKDLDAVEFGEVFDTSEAQHPDILRAVEIVRAVVPEDWEVTPVAVIVTISFMMSLAVELAPMVMFGFVFSQLHKPSTKSGLEIGKAANSPTPPMLVEKSSSMGDARNVAG